MREIDLWDRAGGLHTGSLVLGERLAQLLEDQGVHVIQHFTIGYFIAEVDIEGERKYLRFDINAFPEQFATIEEDDPEEPEVRRDWLERRLREWVKRCSFDTIYDLFAKFTTKMFDHALHKALYWFREAETRDFEVRGFVLETYETGFTMITEKGHASFSWGNQEWIIPADPYPCNKPKKGDQVHFRVSPSTWRKARWNDGIEKVQKAIRQLKKTTDEISRQRIEEQNGSPTVED